MTSEKDLFNKWCGRSHVDAFFSAVNAPPNLLIQLHGKVIGYFFPVQNSRQLLTTLLGFSLERTCMHGGLKGPHRLTYTYVATVTHFCNIN